MQELFVDKIHFFKFLCMSDKPRLPQLNIITSSPSSTVQAFLTARIFSFVRWNTPCWEQIQKPHQFIKHAKIPYSIVPLVFHKFSYGIYRYGLNQVPQSWGTPSISKSTNRVSSITFIENPHFIILLHRVRYLKNLFRSRK